MNITELQSLLHEQAEHVDDQGTAVRGSQMQHRIVVAKRRRTAGAVAALAVVLAGTAAGLATLPGNDDTAPVTPDDKPVFRESFAGRTLVASLVTEQGEPDHTLVTDVDTDKLLFNIDCFAAGDDTWYHLSINGSQFATGACVDLALPEELGGVGGYEGGFKGLTATGGSLTMTIWTSKGDRGPRITDPTAVLAVGVYRQPGAAGTIAGHEIYDLTEFEGRTWQLESRTESAADARRYEASATGDLTRDRIAMVYVNGAQGRTKVLVNGQVEFQMGGGGGTTLPVPVVDGERQVEVRNADGDRGTIGIAWYVALD